LVNEVLAVSLAARVLVSTVEHHTLQSDVIGILTS